MKKKYEKQDWEALHRQYMRWRQGLPQDEELNSITQRALDKTIARDKWPDNQRPVKPPVFVDDFDESELHAGVGSRYKGGAS